MLSKYIRVDLNKISKNISSILTNFIFILVHVKNFISKTLTQIEFVWLSI